ncbi:hypothetical protein [Aquimarina macrocephali]|uniref:hypothetical protein n=1 Tax=Aquimarina macrocephali TaxID=666563 RepID=UPI003F67D049
MNTDNLVIIDKTKTVSVQMTRGQIFRFALESDTCPYDDNAIGILSYAKSKKSIISTATISNEGITKKPDGKLYIELDGLDIRSCHDVVYFEFFGFGTGYRHILINIGLTDSAWIGES